MKVSTFGKIGGAALGVINVGKGLITLTNSTAGTLDKSLAAGDVVFGSAGIVGGAIGGTAGTALSMVSLGYGVVAIPIFLGTYYETGPIILEKQNSGLYFPHPYVGK